MRPWRYCLLEEFGLTTIVEETKGLCKPPRSNRSPLPTAARVPGGRGLLGLRHWRTDPGRPGIGPSRRECRHWQWRDLLWRVRARAPTCGRRPVNAGASQRLSNGRPGFVILRHRRGWCASSSGFFRIISASSRVMIGH